MSSVDELNYMVGPRPVQFTWQVSCHKYLFEFFSFLEPSYVLFFMYYFFSASV